MDFLESESDFVPDYDEDLISESSAHADQTENVANGVFVHIKRRNTSGTGCQIKRVKQGLSENLNISNIPVPLPVQNSLGSSVGVGRQCPLCGEFIRNLRRHVSQEHLPWYFNPEVTCWECRSYQGTLCFLRHRHLSVPACSEGYFSERNLYRWLSLVAGLLNEISSFWGLSSVADLLDLVVQRHWYPSCSHYTVSEVSQVLFGLVDRYMGFEPKDNYCVNPPNGVAALLHWEVFFNLLTNLSSEYQIQVKSNQFECPGNRIPNEIADGHLHLSRLLSKFKVKNLSQLQQKVGSDSECTVSVVINNCVFPHCRDSFRSSLYEGVWLTFGQHPRLAESRFSMSELEALVSHPKCVGVGECGLDFSGPSPPVYEKQVSVFKEQVRVAVRYGKPLVLHIRPAKDEWNSLEEVFGLCLSILQSEVSKDHPIYVHCFAGHDGIFRSWSRVFTNILFGISTKVFKLAELQKVVSRMPLHFIALETDSPYLYVDGKVNTPWVIADVAQFVGKLKNLPQTMILQVNFRNIVNFYKL